MNARRSLTYKDAGVDIGKAELLVNEIKPYIKDFFGKKISAFAGGIPLARSYAKGAALFASADGVGTKVMIAQEFGIHDTIGQDLVGMNVNDLVCFGAQPLVFVDYIATGHIQPHTLKTIIASIARACDESDCCLVGGETAEMPDFYAPGHYDVAGFSCGIVDKKNIISGQKVREGDMLIGLPSSGLHSNGFSLVRKALNKTMRTRYVRELLTPTRLYVRPALAACERFHIAQIAHLTGGSFLKKLPKVIRPGYEFVIYKGSWKAQEIFSVIQKQAHLSFEEMYSTFNMGIGMIMVVSRKEHEVLLRFLRTRYQLHAVVIGTVRKGNRKVLFV